MKKKMIVLLLASTLIATGITPAYAADFSDGQTVSVKEETMFSDQESSNFEFSDQVEEVPVIEENETEAASVVVGNELHTINYEGRIILDEAKKFIQLLNIEREKLGVAPVQIDQQMMEKAIKRAPETGVFYEHLDPVNGTQKHDECLAISRMSFDAENTGESLLHSFSTSPGHWRVLTNEKYSRIGAAIIEIPMGTGATGNKVYNYYINVQMGKNDTSYIPYNGGFQNHSKKIYSQKLNKDFFKGMADNDKYVNYLDVGETRVFYPRVLNSTYYHYETGSGATNQVLSVNGGYWKSLTPDIVSVDQNGKVTALAVGKGIVHYCLNDNTDKKNHSEFVFEVKRPVSDEEQIEALKPPVPKVTAKVTNGEVKLSWKWDKENCPSGYEIFKYETKTKKYKRVKKNVWADDTTFTEKLKKGETAKYKVRSYYEFDSDGIYFQKGDILYSNFSEVITVNASGVTNPKPSRPATTKITKIYSNAAKRKISLTWKKVNGVNGYQIYRKAGANGTYKRIKTITNGKTVRYTNSKLKKGTTYSYKIRTYRKGADGKNIYSKWSKVAVKTCK